MAEDRKYVDVAQRGERKIIDIKVRRESPSAFDQEIFIKIRPRVIIFGLIVFLIAFGLFFAGRLSVGESSISLPKMNVSGMFDGLFTFNEKNLNNATAKVVETKVEVNNPEPVKVEQKEETTPVVKQEPTTNTNTSTNATNTTTTPTIGVTITPPTTSTENETLITKYTKVSIAVSDVKFDWKGTWGKIVQVKYTVKNSETGPIKVDHLTMIVKGYDDTPKKMMIPMSARKVEAGTILSGGLNLAQGFSYSDTSAGDLSNVVITFILYDEKDVAVASYQKGFNLKGTTS